MSEIIDITERIQDKAAGPWFVLQDPITDEVHVVPTALLINWVEMEVDIIEPEDFSVVRTIIGEWLHLKGVA